MTIEEDHKFYEQKERLLRRVKAGTATQAQKDWLIRWGFLERPKLLIKPTHKSPTRTNRVYRYRGPMKATPIGTLGGTAQAEPRRKKRSKKRRV
jgi:hypothetical protein